MAPLDHLRKLLQIHKRDCTLIPAANEIEQKRREYQEGIYWLQIECEEFRHSINIAFRLCAFKIVTETFDNLEIQKYRTVHKWEAWKDDQLNAINEKETKGIAIYQKLISDLYNQSQPTIQNQ